jgi:hypothetical protein
MILQGGRQASLYDYGDGEIVWCITFLAGETLMLALSLVDEWTHATDATLHV